MRKKNCEKIAKKIAKTQIFQIFLVLTHKHS
jgi:hypothetical protein